MVVLENLKKTFGKNKAVDGIDLKIREGEIYGVLGPNGAGKSTTINMMCGLLKSTEGKIHIFGKEITKNPQKIKKHIGVVPQDIAIYEDLTAMQNIKFFGRLYGLKGEKLKRRTIEALEFVGLKEKANSIPNSFSGGMKRRLNIACAIVHEPKLIIMDEPTVGIDPQSRNHILESIKKLNSKGCTIIYTSHYMEEVEYICSNLAIIDNGKIVADGTLKSIIDNYSFENIIIMSTHDKLVENSEIASNIIKDLSEFKGITAVTIEKEKILIYNEQDENNLNKVISYFMDKNISIKNIENKKNDLESIFLKLTGKKLRD